MPIRMRVAGSDGVFQEVEVGYEQYMNRWNNRNAQKYPANLIAKLKRVLDLGATSQGASDHFQIPRTVVSEIRRKVRYGTVPMADATEDLKFLAAQLQRKDQNDARIP